MGIRVTQKKRMPDSKLCHRSMEGFLPLPRGALTLCIRCMFCRHRCNTTAAPLPHGQHGTAPVVARRDSRSRTATTMRARRTTTTMRETAMKIKVRGGGMVFGKTPVTRIQMFVFTFRASLDVDVHEVPDLSGVKGLLVLLQHLLQELVQLHERLDHSVNHLPHKSVSVKQATVFWGVPNSRSQ